ncbi:MAG TPA: hypothetical protein VEU96_22640 [Bryobacteraceae bacterium]|nr:hypothetical protein [Bryobacteraceae bacterium]
MLRFSGFFSSLVCLAISYGQTMVDLRTQSKSVDFSAANTTKPFKSGTTLPAICSVGEMFYKSDAPAGTNLYGCTALNTWTQQGATSSSLPGFAGNSGKVLSTDGSSASWNALGGDLTGAIGSAVVTQIQGRAISSVAPQSAQALVWNAATNRWEPQTVSGGSGGSGGITMLSQTNDLIAAKSTSTTLSIGGNCTVSTPCNVRFGGLVYAITSGATATISAGTGLAYVYVSSGGALTVGHNMTVTCSSTCFAQSGITSFPVDCLPLYTWSATANGVWDTNGGVDYRAFVSAKTVQPGTGLAAADSGGRTTISADTTLIGIRAAVPATSSTACIAGSWATDNSYYYVCVATDSWRRATLAAW